MRLAPSRSGQRVDARVVVAHCGFEQCQPVDTPQVHRGGELQEAADPTPGRTPVDRYLGARQQRRLDGSLRRGRRHGGLPNGAVFTLAEGRFQEAEPRLGLRVVAADRGHPLLDFYVPRVPNSGVGPEHFTFTVRQGVR